MKAMKFLRLPVLLSGLFILTSAIEAGKETQRVNNSTAVLTAFSKMKEGIPRELLTECEGVVVIPKLINAGLSVGAKRGKGVAMVKLADGNWSDPVFITLTGGSIGFQVGVQSVDLVLVFKHKGVLAKVKDGDFTMGGDISVAAGPFGRSSTAGTDHKLEAEIYSYSRSRGLFAGISINGSNLAIDKSSNTNFYGKDISFETILGKGSSDNADVKKLKATLSQF